MQTSDLLVLANEHVMEARKSFGQLRRVDAAMARASMCEPVWRNEMQSLLKSCFGVGVAVGVLVREVEAGRTDGAGVSVVLDRAGGYHRAFMVPCIKLAAA